MKPTSSQMFYRAHEKLAHANQTFLFFVEQGMTKAHLQKLIERRPSLWGRFSDWLEKLPKTGSA